jgi:hypothetical protein
MYFIATKQRVVLPKSLAITTFLPPFRLCIPVVLRDSTQICASTPSQVSYSSHARCNAWLWLLPLTESGYINPMTDLHIRKNVREFFPWAASIPGTAVKQLRDNENVRNAILSSRVSISTFFNHIK